MNTALLENIASVRARISAAEISSGRTRGIVQLVAVSKTRNADEVRNACAAGLLDFGENYVQEALSKQIDTQDLPLIWHFIGPLQSNKTRDIANHFDWVHSLSRVNIAKRLNEQRLAEIPLNVCIQVNISEETTKSGIQLVELEEFALTIKAFPRLQLRGLMAIPAPEQPESVLRDQFGQLASAFHALNKSGFNLDTLSMGMSNDLECAIAAGSTMVRIGTAIFGPRLATQ